MTNEKRQSAERIAILKKIENYEKQNFFETDVENDPPTKVLQANEIDYLKKNPINKLKTFFVNRIADKQIDNLILNRQIIIKKVTGVENIRAVDGPAFITSNHFHPFENMAIYKVFKDNQPSKHKFYRVIREGNYTAPPKGFDLFFKHANTLPLSSSPDTMKKFMTALDVLTKKNNYILIYPEQYMWWNYKKPRPFKAGVFKFATKFNVPIIPCFITMTNNNQLDSEGFPIQEYTINILKPILPNPNLSPKENAIYMQKTNEELWKKAYEDGYGKELKYTYEENE